MVGLQLGNRVLQIGHGNPRLISLLAAKVGVSGQASALVTDDAAADTINRAAAARGVLVDVKVAPLRTPPFERAGPPRASSGSGMRGTPPTGIR